MSLWDLHSTDPKSFSYHFSSHNRENLEKLPDGRHYLLAKQPQSSTAFLPDETESLHISSSIAKLAVPVPYIYAFMHSIFLWNHPYMLSQKSRLWSAADLPRVYTQRNLNKMEAVSFIYSYIRNTDVILLLKKDMLCANK